MIALVTVLLVLALSIGPAVIVTVVMPPIWRRRAARERVARRRAERCRRIERMRADASPWLAN